MNPKLPILDLEVAQILARTWAVESRTLSCDDVAILRKKRGPLASLSALHTVLLLGYGEPALALYLAAGSPAFASFRVWAREHLELP